MENTTEFKRWLYTLLQEAEDKLEMSDATLAFIITGVGMDYFLKAFGKKELKGGK